MHIRLVAIVILNLLVQSVLGNEIDWGTGTYRIYDFDGTTALSTNVVSKTSNTACLVQLVYAGLNGIADAANISGRGSSSDDVVVAWSYIGASQPASQATSAGRFTRAGATLGYNNTNYVNGSKFFIRAWDLPAADPIVGAVPTNAYYGNSELFTVNGFSALPMTDQFALTGNFSTVLQAIPEPSVIFFACLGLGLLVGHRRYKFFHR